MRRLVERALVLAAAAAAFVLLYRFPDRDFAILGAAYHRYFAFHSALLPLALYWLRRKVVRPRSLESLAAGAAAGAALAFGVHLLLDVFQPKNVVFPFANTLVRGTLWDDRLWLAGNSLASFALATRSLLRRSPARP